MIHETDKPDLHCRKEKKMEFIPTCTCISGYVYFLKIYIFSDTGEKCGFASVKIFYEWHSKFVIHYINYVLTPNADEYLREKRISAKDEIEKECRKYLNVR